MDTSTTLPEIDETALATSRYLQALTALDDETVRGPSVLPGWTRAHVVAHLSRNADAFTRVLSQAAAGEPASMYPSADLREADIEETVRTQDLAGLLADAESSAARLLDAARRYQAGLDAAYTRTPVDQEIFPVSTVGPRRRTEVEVHHADLDLRYTPADWPPDFALDLVGRRQDELAALGPRCPSMVLSSTDVDGLWKFGVGQGPEIHGRAGDLAWWLVGRGGGHGLTSSSGELPTLGRWR